MTYYVIDAEDCSTSWNVKTEKGEAFSSKLEAIARAKKLAKADPGKKFEIAQAISYATCNVADATLTNLV